MAHSFKLPTKLGQSLTARRPGGLLSGFREYFRYHGVFAPLVRVMRDVDFSRKTMLVAAAFAIPTGIVVSVQLHDQWTAWRTAQLQRDGWLYVHQVDRLVTAVMPRRAVLDNVTPEHAYAPDAEMEKDIEQHYLALANMQDEVGGKFGTMSQWKALTEAYVRLNAPPSANLGLPEGHRQFFARAQALALGVTESAQLSLNTDRRVALLSELSTHDLPRLDEAIGRLHMHIGTLGKQPDRTPAMAEQVLLDVAELKMALADVKTQASRFTPADGETCVHGNEPFFVDGTQFAQGMREFALDAGFQADAAHALQATQTLHKGLRQMRGACLTQLDSAMATHESHIRHRLTWVSGMVLLGIVLAIYVMTAFSRVMRGGMQLIQSEVARMARGDLSGRALARGDDEVADTLRSLRASLARLADLFTVVRRGVSSVSHASGEISSASEDLAARIQDATQAMSGLQQGIATTLEYLEANQQCVAQAVDRARDVTADAGRSRRAMTHLAEVIENLQRRSREIGKIVSLIDGIAFQTNLLALNASVEAAKAGTAGKGFAVVASEVRSLAQRVADAAAQINKVVADSTNEIAQGQEIARGTVEAVLSTEANVTEMGRILTRLAEVTANGRHNAENMTSTLATVNDNSEQTSELVVQVAQAARLLRHQSLKLAEQSSRFKLG
jgi:methyl-accepting chemotaxis protein-1 (serine sensor receptor)